MGTLKLNKNSKKVQLETKKNVIKAQMQNSSDNSDNDVQGRELCIAAKQDDGFVKEFKGKRNANSVAYRRNDRTTRKVIFATPQFYKNSSGEYVEINNKLTDGGNSIANSDNAYKVEFIKENNDKIFNLKKGNKKLSLSLNAGEKGSHSKACKCQMCATADNAVTVLCENGEEIQYLALNDRIKENIIINERKEIYEYCFLMNIGDLTVEEGDNCLLLKDSNSGEMEFIIPVPYMYDANKVRSNKVSYEIDINGEEMTVKVVADSDFINSAERKFPVIIDPQIIVSGSSGGCKIVCTSRVQWFDENGSIDYQSGLCAGREPGGEEWDSTIDYEFTLSKDIKEEAVLSVLLFIEVSDGSRGDFKVNETNYNADELQGRSIEIDITNSYKGTIRIEPNFRTSNYPWIELDNVRFVVNYIGEEPEELVEYLYKDRQYEDDIVPYIKEFNLSDKVTGHMYVKDGVLATSFKSVDASDFVLPINISHVHKLGSGETNFGLNWHLNIEKKLRVATSDTTKTTKYLYTDELGDKYIFNEKYYYLNGTNKVFIDKDKVEIDISGNLTYGSYKVYKYHSCNGYTLIPEINDFKNSELIEQRHSEQIELEEYLNSYEPTLKSYVKVDSESGTILDRLPSLTKSNYEALVSDIDNSSNYLFITEGEALQLSNLYYSLKQTDRQLKQFSLQNRQINYQWLQLEKQVSELWTSINLSKKLYPNKYQNPVNLDTEEIIADTEKNSYERNKQISEIRERISYQNSLSSIKLLEGDAPENQSNLLGIQGALLSSEVSALQTQSKLIEKQKEYLINHARDNLANVKELFIQYFSKKAQLDLISLHTPINYIKDPNGIISGFNANGDLVVVTDSYGNYVNIVYDSSKRISSIYDSNNKILNFEYTNGRLFSITDNLGRTVTYSYDSNKLNTVTRADGSSLIFKYSSNLICTIDSRKEIQTKLSYDASKRITEIINWSTPLTIGKTVSRSSNSYSAIINNFSINYGIGNTSINDAENNFEKYEFYDDEKLKTHCTRDNKFNEFRTVYEYANTNGRKITATTTENGEKPKVNIKQYNVIDMLVTETDDWYYVSDTVQVKTVKEYTYDINNNLVEEKINKYTDDDGDEKVVVSYTKYCYNANGSLSLTESYVEGEELTSGKTFVSNEYDENGNIAKTIRWNSLDSSTKFYVENDYADNGQRTADRNEVGEVSAEYEYIEGTNVVNAIKYPNGAKFAYGRNPYNYNVTSVTQSTEQGEANTTNILHTYDLPVEVKSGNTIIDYTYDYKGRKKSVKINGNTLATYLYKDYTKEENKIELSTSSEILHISDAEIVSTISIKEANLNTSKGVYEVAEILNKNAELVLQKKYDYKNRLISVENHVGNDCYTGEYTYDKYDRITQISIGLNDEEEVLNECYVYNQYGDISVKQVSVENMSHAYIYEYKDDARRTLDRIEFANNTIYPLTDVHGRNTGKEIFRAGKKFAGEYISYRKVGDHATNMPSTVFFGGNHNGFAIKDNLKYKYDKCGNITEIYENGDLKIRYTYDSLNRLIREDNKAFNQTWLINYDNNGNILNRNVTYFTLSSSINQEDFQKVNYFYEGDRLVEYNGERCIYNNIGSPTTYRGTSATWLYGKLLSKYGSVEFTYDGEGKRICKGEIKFRYDSEGHLVKQFVGSAIGPWKPGAKIRPPEEVGQSIEFVYDHTGLFAINNNGEVYYYRKDAQGNVIALLDTNGNVVVKYEYDAWGNHAVLDSEGYDIEDPKHIGNVNPFRYRGYYYDTETGLYYLQSRYYDPETGRFISQDSIEYADPETINGLNLYAYCGNNPVMGYDPDGTLNLGIFATIAMGILCVAAVVAGIVLSGTAAGAQLGAVLLAAGVGGLISMGASIVSQGKSNGWSNINWGQVAFNGVTGVAIGALMASPISHFVAGLAIGAISFVESVGNDLFDYKGDWTQVNWSKAVLYAMASGVISGIAKSYVNYDKELMELGVKESFYAMAKPISSILRAVLKICFNWADKSYIRRQNP